eukprot:jgi/Mesen1/2198/ME000152S01285
MGPLISLRTLWFWSPVLFLMVQASDISPQPIRAVAPPHGSPEDLPLPYVGATVTGAKILMDASQVTAYDGPDKDNIIVDIVAQGPVPWSISRFNRGDFSPRLQPRHPYAQSNLGVPAGKLGFAASDSKDFSAQAWRPSIERGVMLASVAQNGQKWSDGSPLFYGTVACVMQSSGYGYSMTSGEFGSSDPNIDVTVGKAGKLSEGSIDISIAWFPYDQGWMAGYVTTPGKEKHATPQWAAPSSHSKTVPSNASTVVRWGKRGASLMLPGVNDYKDGMLFATSADPGPGNDDVNSVSVYFSTWKHRNRWRITQREDSAAEVDETASRDGLHFAFLYVPFTTGGLIGAIINGDTGKAYHGRGEYTCQRLSTGRYKIEVHGPRGPGQTGTKTDSADAHADADAGDHFFVVEARHLALNADGSEEFPLVNAGLASTGGASRGSWGFWSGYFFAMLTSVLSAAAVYGGLFTYARRKLGQLSSQYLPGTFPDGVDSETELGNGLLSREYASAD